MRKALRWIAGPYEANEKYAAAADLLRVICVLVVAWYHFWQQSWLNPVFTLGNVRLDFNPIVRSGYLMVDLLLMLSGFLLFLPYARCIISREKLPALGDYYKKRVARIVPSYLFCILIILFCFALPRGEYYSMKQMWTDLLTHLTFTHTFSSIAYQSTKLNGALWTLAVEVQFYLIAPFVGRAFVKKPFWTYLAMLIVAFVYRYVIVLPMDSHTLWLNQLPAMMDVYANGMMGALIYVTLCKYVRKSGWMSLIFTVLAGLSAMAVYFLMRGQSHTSGYPAIHIGQMMRRFPLSAAGTAFVVFAGLGLNSITRIISSGPVRWLSMISYNVYIWHSYAAIKLKEWHIPPYENPLPNQVGEQTWQTLYTLLCFATAILLGALATYLIEKPAARLLLKPRRRGKHAART